MFKIVYDLDFLNNSDFYYKILSQENFNFKTKDIKVSIKKLKNRVKIVSNVKNILDLKIVTSTISKTLEVIEKTRKI